MADAFRRTHIFASENDSDWERYDLSIDIQEKRNIASDYPDILKQLTGYAEDAHQPVRKGQIFDRAVIQKDRRQAPHNRTSK